MTVVETIWSIISAMLEDFFRRQPRKRR
jgi:hypothetical protein